MTEFDISDAAFEGHGPLPKPPTMGQHLGLAWGDFATSVGNKAALIDEGRLRMIGPVGEVLAAYQAMV